jgi:hypothetical protein
MPPVSLPPMRRYIPAPAPKSVPSYKTTISRYTTGYSSSYSPAPARIYRSPAPEPDSPDSIPPAPARIYRSPDPEPDECCPPEPEPECCPPEPEPDCCP